MYSGEHEAEHGWPKPADEFTKDSDVSDPKPEATPAFVEPLEPTEEMPKESDKTEEPEDNKDSDHVADDNQGGVFFKE